MSVERATAHVNKILREKTCAPHADPAHWAVWMRAQAAGPLRMSPWKLACRWRPSTVSSMVDPAFGKRLRHGFGKQLLDWAIVLTRSPLALHVGA